MHTLRTVRADTQTLVGTWQGIARAQQWWDAKTWSPLQGGSDWGAPLVTAHMAAAGCDYNVGMSQDGEHFPCPIVSEDRCDIEQRPFLHLCIV